MTLFLRQVPDEIVVALQAKLVEFDGNMAAAERFFEMSRAAILAVAARSRVHYGTILRVREKLGLMTDGTHVTKEG